jgi:hypothetical protein
MSVSQQSPSDGNAPDAGADDEDPERLHIRPVELLK